MGGQMNPINGGGKEIENLLSQLYAGVPP